MRKSIFFLFIAANIFFKLSAQSVDERKAPNITVTHQTLINASVDEVWAVLAEDYGGIGKWASGVNHVIESSGAGLHAERSCDISAKGFNDTKERITVFQPDDYSFTYDLYEGLPRFVKYSTNTYQLIASGAQTLCTATNEMRVGGLMGATMKGVMRNSLQKVMEAMGEELKYFVETGRQHPNKIMAIAKAEGKVAFVVEQEIDVSIDKVWEVLVDDFPAVADSSPLSPKSEFTDGHTEVRVGARRIMYKSNDLQKYFKDEITLIDAENHNFTIDVIEAKGYPNTFTRLAFKADAIGTGSTRLRIVFTYETRPRFLQRIIKRPLQKDIQDYLFAIDHHVETGEVINNENWKLIRQNYR